MSMKFDFDSVPVVQTKYGKLRGYCCGYTAKRRRSFH